MKASPWTTTPGRRYPGSDPDGLGEVGPPDLALGDHHSVGGEGPAGGLAGERVGPGLAEVREDGVEARGHLVGRVARDVLAQRGAVDLAAGAAGALREAVHLREQVVGHRDGGLHTRSITAPSRGQAPRDR